MSTSADVRIEMSAHGVGRVFVNDRELKGVVRVEFSAAHGQPNTCTLSLIPEKVTIQGPADIAQPEPIGG